MNIFKLITDASPVVQLILLILLFFSVFSWTIIIFKRKMLKVASLQSQKFLAVFKKTKNLTEVNEASKAFQASPLAAIFQAGYKEMSYLAKTNPQGNQNSSRLENLSRALTKASNAEVVKMERLMSFLEIGRAHV